MRECRLLVQDEEEKTVKVPHAVAEALGNLGNLSTDPERFESCRGPWTGSCSRCFGQTTSRSRRVSANELPGVQIRLQCLLVGAVHLRIFRRSAQQNAQVCHFVEMERRGAGGRGDGDEVDTVDTCEEETGARVRRGRGDLNMTHLEIADMTKKEALGWHGAEHAGIRIFVFVLLWPDGEGVLRRSAEGMLVDVG